MRMRNPGAHLTRHWGGQGGVMCGFWFTGETVFCFGLRVNSAGFIIGVYFVRSLGGGVLVCYPEEGRGGKRRGYRMSEVHRME